MNETTYTQLQTREIFHLEFLRALGRKIKQGNYALKGGANLRFYFNSFRYSEDMDLDAQGVSVRILKETVMDILASRTFQEALKPFGIEKAVPPDIGKAKQTETTQRFKIHLLTAAQEDLFTKVEFSRRGFDGDISVQQVSEAILRHYKIAPLLCPHYSAGTAVFQKIKALVMRSAIQARDVFDLYILSPQADLPRIRKISGHVLKKARENALEIGFEQFRDTVVSYLAPEDRPAYENAAAWDEIKLKVADFLEKIGENDA